MEIIEESAFAQSKVIEINIPSTVTSIEKRAFYSCTSLNKVVLPNIENLRQYTFYKTAISSIDLPLNLVKIESFCFYQCTKLTSVILPDGLQTLDGNAFSETTNIQFGENSNFYLDSQKLIIDKKNLTISQYIGPNEAIDFTILASITNIKPNAFYDKSNLQSIIFPSDSKLQVINDYCFYNCYNLNFVSIPHSLTYIGRQAFYNCYNLKTISSNVVTSIASDCFYGCKNLISANFEDSSLENFASSCFYGCTSLVSITLPYHLTNIYANCFGNCTKLNSVVFPSTLITIYENAFQNTALTTVDLLSCNSLNEISNFAFSNIEKLTKIILPQNLNIINVEAFSYTSITNFTVPLSLTTIGSNAFRSCSKLSTLNIPAGSVITSFGLGAFRDCISISMIECESSNFAIVTGALFDSTRTSLILFPPASTVKYFSFPSDTRTINEGAFMSCKNIVSLFIPTNSISRISRSAFENCVNLKWINIPLSVIYIGEDVFLGCRMISCGIEIENKTKEFRENLIKSCKLDSIALKECRGLVTQRCFHIYHQNIILLAVFIIM